MDSTMMGDDLQLDSRGNELRDEILWVPRRSEAEKTPELERRADNGPQRSQVVQDWMEKSPPATRAEAPADPEVGAGAPPVWPMEQPWVRTEMEVQLGPEFRVAAPPMLPMEHPWVDRAADDFWEELQDKVMIDAEPSQARRSQGGSQRG